MKAQQKAVVLSASVVAIQAGFVAVARLSLGVSDFGRVMIGALFVGALVLLVRDIFRLLGAHSSSMLVPFVIIGVGLLWYKSLTTSSNI